MAEVEIRSYLEELMNTLAAYAEAFAYFLNGSAFISESGDSSVLFRVAFRIRMGMYEQELTPVVSALGLPNRTLAATLLFGDGAQDDSF